MDNLGNMSITDEVLGGALELNSNDYVYSQKKSSYRNTISNCWICEGWREFIFQLKGTYLHRPGEASICAPKRG